MSTTVERGPAGAGPDDAGTTGRIPLVHHVAPRPAVGPASWAHPAPGPVPPAGFDGAAHRYGRPASGPYAGPRRHADRHAGPAPYAGPAHPAGPDGHAPGPLAAPSAPRPAMRWGWLGLGLVAAVLAVVLIGSFASGQRTMTVYGTATVSGMTGWVTPGQSCSSTAAAGTPVSIYDASGDLVGTSSLTGYGTARNTWNTYYYGYSDSCAYSFSVADVAAGDDYYRVKVGSGEGQGVGFSADQMVAGAVEVTVR